MMYFVVSVLLTLCTSVGVVLRYAPFSPVITAQQKRSLLITYGVLAAVNITVWTLVLSIQGWMAAFNYLRYGGIVYAVALSLVNIFVIRGRIREHLFAFGVVLTCTYLLMSIPNYAITFLTQPNVKTNLFIVLGIYSAVLLLTLWPLRLLLCRTVTPFLEMNNSEYWSSVWFIPIAFFGTKFLSLGGEHNTGGYMQLISSMLYIVVIILMCVSISASNKRIRKQDEMEKQLANQKLHYAELRVRVENARKAKHDFKHHIAAIRHYMNIDDKEGLARYCDDLTGTPNVQMQIPYTGNAAVDGVLYNVIQRAHQKNVSFSYTGTIHSPGIADMDLCVLLGNALDNALYGCMRLPEGRSISLICQTEKQILSIVVRNTFDGKIMQHGDVLLSRKRENQEGVGLASMGSICEKYGGSMQYQWDEENFTIAFVLPLTNE